MASSKGSVRALAETREFPRRWYAESKTALSASTISDSKYLEMCKPDFAALQAHLIAVI
jgi:hypothetical protein